MDQARVVLEAWVEEVRIFREEISLELSRKAVASV